MFRNNVLFWTRDKNKIKQNKINLFVHWIVWCLPSVRFNCLLFTSSSSSFIYLFYFSVVIHNYAARIEILNPTGARERNFGIFMDFFYDFVEQYLCSHHILFTYIIMCTNAWAYSLFVCDTKKIQVTPLNLIGGAIKKFAKRQPIFESIINRQFVIAHSFTPISIWIDQFSGHSHI